MRSNTSLPPPTRKPARRLSLKIAMAAAMKSEDHAPIKPLMSPMDGFPELSSCKQQDMQACLLELQADIINRERLLNESEKRLQHYQLEINEREALLEASKQVIEASIHRKAQRAPSISTQENEAIEAFKHELENQAKSLKDARRILHEREVYIESCENKLVEKSITLTEREARVEQREEDLESNSNSPAPTTVKSAKDAAHYKCLA
jgi:hypothetical protein